MRVAIIEGTRPTLKPEGPHVEQNILGPDVDIACYGMLDPGKRESVLGAVDAVILRPGTPFSKEMVLMLKKARVIVSLGVGYDHIAVEAAREMNIPVCNVPDYGTQEVADSTVAMLLAHQRKLFSFRQGARKGPLKWDWRIHMPITRTSELRVGIIGLGRIGMAVAMRLKPFGYNIAFYDPYLARGIEKSLSLGRLHSLEQLLGVSDIVSVHTPLTEMTTGMIDEAFFRQLKPRAILLNTARGGIFKNADAIYRFLREEPEARIGSDVWPDEPPAEHPLLDAWRNGEPWLGDRLILSPHSAFYSEEAIYELRSRAAEIVREVLAGNKPYNIVNGVAA